MPQLLIVEDDPSIAELVRYNAERAGFTCDVAQSGAEALAKVAGRTPDLIVLDVMLPGDMDGFDVCRAIRRRSDVPILMLTARKDEIDRVLGLELGADDYLAKPFSPRELTARIRAILRRGRPIATGLRYDQLEVDVEARLAHVSGRPLDLTYTEFDLLAALLGERPRVLSRQALLDRLRGQSAYYDDRTIDVHVRHLRAKLEQAGGRSAWIETVRGAGYRFTPLAPEAHPASGAEPSGERPEA